LHPFIAETRKTYMPATCHTMSREDKSNFLKVLRNVRVMDGYASTFLGVFDSRNVRFRG